MTIPPVIRIFFAIGLSQETKIHIGAFLNSLKKSSRSHAIRWTRPENLHITLQFLAKVQSKDLALLVKNVQQQLNFDFQNTLINFKSLQLFPNNYRPRVIVLDIVEQAILGKLSEKIGVGIRASNYEIESRVFRAHLTLGRIKHPHSIKLDFLANASVSSLNPIAVKEVVLFRSEPLPEGSQYTVLQTMQLTSPFYSHESVH